MPANEAYGLVVGDVRLNGSATLNVANNGTGAGTLTLGAVLRRRAAATLAKGGGHAVLPTAAASIVNGTQLAVVAGTVQSNHALALGTLARVDVADAPR